MLDEEDNADYAINELAYIRKLRQKRGEDIQPEDNDPSDSLPQPPMAPPF